MNDSPTTTCIAPWFGSNRMLGKHVGAALRGCSWVGVPFAGGMAELAHIEAREILVSDLHRHVINLAMVAAHPVLGPKLYRQLRRLPFHPDALAMSQKAAAASIGLLDGEDHVRLWSAVHYFVAVWMGRSAKAGIDGELQQSLSARWTASGGGSAVRYRSAASSLPAWRRIMARCNFTCLDVFEFLSKVKDQPGHGLYLDAPFPGPGDIYVHKFTEEQHVWLASKLRVFAHCRVVCRFYDVPLIRQLYPENYWTWQFLEGRKQTNDSAPEVLIVRNG